MNAYRFNGRSPCRLAALSIILSLPFWFLGNFDSFSLASGRITGAEAVAKMSAILGSPEAFAENMKLSTQDFIKDHFGSMAVACAFGLAMKKMAS
jgi:hypothetical protein